MRLLLDTHVVLWWLTGNRRLTPEVKELIEHEPDVLVSSASVWEMAVKQALGKLRDPPDLPERVLGTGLGVLDVTARHGIAAARLPLLHRDPFDRIIIAQARLEDLVLATSDRDVQRYDVRLLRI